MSELTCPKCSTGENIIGIEYWWGHQEHYDGISEWYCKKCNTRWGRWSGNILADGECEKRFGGETTLPNKELT